MKILQVIHDFLISCKAGSELHTYYLSKELSKENVVKLFFTIPEDGCGQDVIEGSYDRIPYWAVKKNFTSYYRHPFQERDRQVERIFNNILDEFSPDVIHFHNLLNLSLKLPSLAKKRGIPTCFTLHDYWLICPRIILLTPEQSICEAASSHRCVNCLQNGNGRCRFRTAGYVKKVVLFISQTLWRTYWLKKVFRDIDWFISPSQFLLDKFVKRGISREKIVLVPHGLAQDSFRNITRKKSLTIRFGFIGTISIHKGIYILIDAFNKVHGPAELKIYGKVPSQMMPELQKRIGNSAIHIMGELDEENKVKIFSEIDVMIMPSIWYENCPLIINEAFLAKNPIITSNIGGMNELVVDGKYGFTFPVGNSDKLAEKIQQFIDNPDLIRQFSSNLPAVKDIRCNAKEIMNLYKNPAPVPSRMETAP